VNRLVLNRARVVIALGWVTLTQASYSQTKPLKKINVGLPSVNFVLTFPSETKRR
jgi:hypothetical protein